MKRLLATCFFALALGSTSAQPVLAAEKDAHDHHSMEGHDNMDSMPMTWTDGEVRRIEKDAGKLTLRHGEVKNLKMAAMTMGWKVKDPAMLDTLKVGDKILFTAEKLDGQFTVTAIKMAP